MQPFRLKACRECERLRARPCNARATRSENAACEDVLDEAMDMLILQLWKSSR
jgi:hypothetical protein